MGPVAADSLLTVADAEQFYMRSSVDRGPYRSRE